MRVFGIVTTACGVAWLLIAFNFDTTVGTSIGRVENIGLISQRQNHLYLAGLLSLVGVLVWIFGNREPSQNSQGKSASRHSILLPPSERRLDSDPYRLWLAEKYEIHRSETFRNTFTTSIHSKPWTMHYWLHMSMKLSWQSMMKTHSKSFSTIRPSRMRNWPKCFQS